MGEIPFPGWDPVLFDLPGSIDIRYYGLMYMVGFVLGHIILTRLARRGFLPIAEEKVGDLIFYLILGVILGGRLGYIIFYKPEIFSAPLELFKIWKGGLSFHGGLLGVVVAFMWFARKNGFPGWRLCDCMALAVPPGIFAVRIANFINGELYGRITQGWWGMRFPTDPVAMRVLGISPGMGKREVELAILDAFDSGKWDQVKNIVPMRHPSQLYEAGAEGLLLGLIMMYVYRRTRDKPLGTGVYGGVFLLAYGVPRFFIEYARQPDAHLGFVLSSFSMGQVLCFAMIVIGVVMILARRRHLLVSPPLERPESTPEKGPE